MPSAVAHRALKANAITKKQNDKLPAKLIDKGILIFFKLGKSKKL